MTIIISKVDPLVKMLPVVILPFLLGFLALIVYSILKDYFKKRKVQRQLIADKREQDRLRAIRN